MTLQSVHMQVVNCLASGVPIVTPDFFRDLGEWRERYHLLQDTVAFLVATINILSSLPRSWCIRILRVNDFVKINL